MALQSVLSNEELQILLNLDGLKLKYSNDKKNKEDKNTKDIMWDIIHETEILNALHAEKFELLKNKQLQRSKFELSLEEEKSKLVKAKEQTNQIIAGANGIANPIPNLMNEISEAKPPVEEKIIKKAGKLETEIKALKSVLISLEATESKLQKQADELKEKISQDVVSNIIGSDLLKVIQAIDPNNEGISEARIEAAAQVRTAFALLKTSNKIQIHVDKREEEWDEEPTEERSEEMQNNKNIINNSDFAALVKMDQEAIHAGMLLGKVNEKQKEVHNQREQTRESINMEETKLNNLKDKPEVRSHLYPKSR